MWLTAFYFGVNHMLVSCSHCNGIHKRSERCKARIKNNCKKYVKKEENNITRFRRTNAWKCKSLEIRNRDLHLCQLCIYLHSRYSFTKLSVHHIIPISRNFNKRLDNYNLITLCPTCHEMAENKFSVKILQELAAEQERKRQNV